MMEYEAPCGRCGDTDFEGQVCRTCGAVVDELYFGSEFNVFGSDNKPKFIHFNVKKRKPPGLELGLTVFENLCTKYGLTPDLKVEAEDLLKLIYESKSFARKQDVGILAGCCLNHIKQKHNQYISLSDLSAKLQCSMKQVYKFSKMIKVFCNDLQSNSAEPNSNFKEDIISDEKAYSKSTLNKLESVIPKMFASVIVDNRDEFLKKSIALVKLSCDCWLMSGRSPDGIITAAGFLTWKSLHPGSKLNFKQFCSDFSFSYAKAVPKVLEMKKMLLKMGKKIPSDSKDYVNEKNILFHLGYILENSETLRNDLLTDTYGAEEIAKKEFSMYRKPSTVTKEDDVGNVEKRCDFQPSMVSDVEISDSEIVKYIRSEKEVKLIKRLKELYDS